jgi:hypothetical protein
MAALSWGAGSHAGSERTEADKLAPFEADLPSNEVVAIVLLEGLKSVRTTAFRKRYQAC